MERFRIRPTRSLHRTNSSSAWVIAPTPQFKVAVDIVRSSTRRISPTTPLSSTSAGNTRSCPAARHRFFVRTGLYTGKEGELNATTPTTKTTTTGTFGGGAVIGQQFQVDLAVLTRKELVVSAAYRF